MARKNVLKGLMETAGAAPKEAAPASPEPSPAPPASAPRSNRGAIGAVSRSIADLKSRAVAEIDADLIDAGGVQDRLETDGVEDAALKASIEAHGQQVPVLVRPHPEAEGRFQIVYGRRRVLALRDLGQPVKALIRELDDQELVLAQGQENTARRDLSFIEKVSFARQLEELSYSRKVICDALTVDKTLVSRMLSLAARVPAELIAQIGAAPSIGRDRWTVFADRLQASDATLDEIGDEIARAQVSRSDDRFLAAMTYLERRISGATAPRPATDRPAPVAISAPDGAALGQARLSDKSCTLQLQGASVRDGFAPWLIEELPALYAEWQARQGKTKSNS